MASRRKSCNPRKIVKAQLNEITDEFHEFDEEVPSETLHLNASNPDAPIDYSTGDENTQGERIVDGYSKVQPENDENNNDQGDVTKEQPESKDGEQATSPENVLAKDSEESNDGITVGSYSADVLNMEPQDLADYFVKLSTNGKQGYDSENQVGKETEMDDDQDKGNERLTVGKYPKWLSRKSPEFLARYFASRAKIQGRKKRSRNAEGTVGNPRIGRIKKRIADLEAKVAVINQMQTSEGLDPALHGKTENECEEDVLMDGVDDTGQENKAQDQPMIMPRSETPDNQGEENEDEESCGDDETSNPAAMLCDEGVLRKNSNLETSNADDEEDNDDDANNDDEDDDEINEEEMRYKLDTHQFPHQPHNIHLPHNIPLPQTASTDAAGDVHLKSMANTAVAVEQVVPQNGEKFLQDVHVQIKGLVHLQIVVMQTMHDIWSTLQSQYKQLHGKGVELPPDHFRDSVLPDFLRKVAELSSKGEDAVQYQIPATQDIFNHFMSNLSETEARKIKLNMPQFMDTPPVPSSLAPRMSQPPTPAPPVRSQSHTPQSNKPVALNSSTTLLDRSQYAAEDPIFKHKCRFCHKVLGSDSALQIHVRSHTGEKPYKCNICNNRFSTKGNLKVHFDRHKREHPNVEMDEALYLDPVSTDTMPPSMLPTLTPSTVPSLPPSLVSNIPATPGTPGTPMSAPMMPTLPTLPNLPTPQKPSTPLPSKPEPNSPKAPGKVEQKPNVEHPQVSMPMPFPFSSSMQLPSSMSSPLTSQPHMMNHMGMPMPMSPFNNGQFPMPFPPFPMDSPMFRQSILPQKQEEEDSMEQYMEIEKSETDKLEMMVKNMDRVDDPNQCAICKRVLSCKSALQMHYRVHTGERPFKCKICRRAFTTKGNLKTHMGVHRTKAPLRMTHPCPVCHKEFTNNLVLQQHIRTHKGFPMENGPMPFPPMLGMPGMFPQGMHSPNFNMPGMPLPPRPPTNGDSRGSPIRSPPTGSDDEDDGKDANSVSLAADEAYNEQIEREMLEDREREEGRPSAKMPRLDLEPEEKSSQSPHKPIDAPVQHPKEFAAFQNEQNFMQRPLDALEERVKAIGESKPSQDNGAVNGDAPQQPGSRHSPAEPQSDAQTPKPDAPSESQSNGDHLPSEPQQNGLNASLSPVPPVSESYSTPSKSDASSSPKDMPSPAMHPPPIMIAPDNSQQRRPVKNNHVCVVCQKPFASSSGLQIHMRTHTGERPFKCEVCEKAFTTRGNLKVHMTTHSQQTNPAHRGRRISMDPMSGLEPPKASDFPHGFPPRLPTSDMFPMGFPGAFPGFPMPGLFNPSGMMPPMPNHMMFANLMPQKQENGDNNNDKDLAGLNSPAFRDNLNSGEQGLNLSVK